MNMENGQIKAPPPSAVKLALCRAKENAEEEVEYYATCVKKQEEKVSYEQTGLTNYREKLNRYEDEVNELREALENVS